MNKDLERYLIIVLLLVLIGLTNCAKKDSINTNPKLPDTVKEEKPLTITDSVGRMQGVADALVCMFSPETCEARKEKETSR